MKLYIVLLIFFTSQIVMSQQFDTTDYDKSTISNSNNNKRDFIKTYGLKDKKVIMAKVMSEFELRSQPSCDSKKTGVIVPMDSIIFIYKYFPEEKCWVTQYHGQWGFITDSKVFPISKRTLKANKYDIPPQLRTSISPKYPKEAKKKGIKGKVYIKVFIDKTGKATKTIVLKGFPELNQAAIDAVIKAKYKPAIYQKEKVGVWVTLFLDFK